jgi:hypothetical protein
VLVAVVFGVYGSIDRSYFFMIIYLSAFPRVWSSSVIWNDAHPGSSPGSYKLELAKVCLNFARAQSLKNSTYHSDAKTSLLLSVDNKLLLRVGHGDIGLGVGHLLLIREVLVKVFGGEIFRRKLNSACVASL